MTADEAVPAADEAAPAFEILEETANSRRKISRLRLQS